MNSEEVMWLFAFRRKTILSKTCKERSGMAESALMVKLKAFALEVIRSCRVLREAKCEGALINQFCAPVRASGQMSAKHFMHKEGRISSQSYILP